MPQQHARCIFEAVAPLGVKTSPPAFGGAARNTARGGRSDTLAVGFAERSRVGSDIADCAQTSPGKQGLSVRVLPSGSNPAGPGRVALAPGSRRSMEEKKPRMEVPRLGGDEPGRRGPGIYRGPARTEGSQVAGPGPVRRVSGRNGRGPAGGGVYAAEPTPQYPGSRPIHGRLSEDLSAAYPIDSTWRSIEEQQGSGVIGFARAKQISF